MGTQAKAVRRLTDKFFTRLTLSRKTHESIVIGGGLVVIEFNQARGHRSSVTIHAPRELPIDRGEVWAAKQRERGSDTEFPALGRIVDLIKDAS